MNRLGSGLKVKTELTGSREIQVVFSGLTPGQLMSLVHSLKKRPESPVAQQVLNALKNSFRPHRDSLKAWGV